MINQNLTQLVSELASFREAGKLDAFGMYLYGVVLKNLHYQSNKTLPSIPTFHCSERQHFKESGMGGGTGTGAAPVIAKAAKDLDILTVAIVTIPFEFEGDLRMKQAREGIEELKQHVDSLIVINNNKLREIYGKLGFKSGFAKADEILATASRGIAEVITGVL